MVAGPLSENMGSTIVSEITFESIIERDQKSTSLWILRVGDYGTDWRVSKKLYENAQASGDFTTYHKKMAQMQSQEALARIVITSLQMVSS